MVMHFFSLLQICQRSCYPVRLACSCDQQPLQRQFHNIMPCQFSVDNSTLPVCQFKTTCMNCQYSTFIFLMTSRARILKESVVAPAPPVVGTKNQFIPLPTPNHPEESFPLLNTKQDIDSIFEQIQFLPEDLKYYCPDVTNLSTQFLPQDENPVPFLVTPLNDKANLEPHPIRAISSPMEVSLCPTPSATVTSATSTINSLTPVIVTTSFPNTQLFSNSPSVPEESSIGINLKKPVQVKPMVPLSSCHEVNHIPLHHDSGTNKGGILPTRQARVKPKKRKSGFDTNIVPQTRSQTNMHLKDHPNSWPSIEDEIIQEPETNWSISSQPEIDETVWSTSIRLRHQPIKVSRSFGIQTRPLTQQVNKGIQTTQLDTLLVKRKQVYIPPNTSNPSNANKYSLLTAIIIKLESLEGRPSVSQEDSRMKNHAIIMTLRNLQMEVDSIAQTEAIKNISMYSSHLTTHLRAKSSDL